MDPISALIGGGASLLGNIFTSSTSAANTQANIAAQEMMQQQTEQFNAQQAQINRDYQTTMSNTAYQRASQDMQKAGLNPAMMFGSGGPASSPAGGSAAVGTPNMALSNKTSPFSNLGDVISKAVSTSGAVRGLDKLNEETRKEKADADYAENEAEKSRLGIPQARYDAMKAGFRLGMKPDDIETAATHEERFGPGSHSWGGQALETGANILNRTVQKIVDGVTGPSGKAMWDRARQTFSGWNTPSNNPNVRGTTLNNDFGAGVAP